MGSLDVVQPTLRSFVVRPKRRGKKRRRSDREPSVAPKQKLNGLSVTKLQRSRCNAKRKRSPEELRDVLVVRNVLRAEALSAERHLPWTVAPIPTNALLHVSILLREPAVAAGA